MWGPHDTESGQPGKGCHWRSTRCVLHFRRYPADWPQLRRIVKHVRGSPQRRRTWEVTVRVSLDQLDKDLSEAQLMLILDVRTRWTSTHQMLREFSPFQPQEYSIFESEQAARFTTRTLLTDMSVMQLNSQIIGFPTRTGMLCVRCACGLVTSAGPQQICLPQASLCFHRRIWSSVNSKQASRKISRSCLMMLHPSSKRDW